MKLISILLILAIVIGVQSQFVLNGQATDSCPFYTQVVGNECVDNYLKSLAKPTILNEGLFRTSFQLTDFELTGWIKGNLDTQNRYISQCGGRSIYGGFEQIPGNNLVRSISRSFLDLPEHYQLSIKFQFYFIDSWDKEYLRVYVDDKEVYSYRFNDNGVTRTPVCGQTHNGWNEYILNISLEVTHTAPIANIKIQWELDQTSTDESGGLREIQIISLGYPTYNLNGKTTNFCPFYTTLDENNNCVDNYVNSLQAPQILSESLYNRYFTDTDQLTQQGWTIGNIQADNKYVSVCGEKSIYGGFGALTTGDRTKFISAEFNNLAPHSKLMIKFNFFFIDSWDNENLVVLVDDVQAFRYTHQHNAAGTVATCGSAWKELEKTFEIPVDHFSNNAKIRIEWTLDSGNSDESGGIREIQVVLVGNPTFDLNGQQVDSCPPYTTLNLDDKKCVDTFYQKQRDPQPLSQTLINKNFGSDVFDTGSWTIQPAETSKRYTSICDGKSILGGHQAYPSTRGVKSVQSTFNNLGQHDFISIKFNFYFVDSWDNEVLAVFVDGVQVFDRKQHVYEQKNYHICGNGGWKDWSESFDLQIEHTSATAEIKIQWSVDQEPSDESGGIRDIQIFAYKIPIYNLNGNYVTKCPFYAPLNETTLTCVDPLVESLSKPIIINEALTNKKFTGESLSEQGWSSALLGTQLTSVCEGITVFGGYSAFVGSPSSGNSITGKFNRIAPHNSVVIRFLFYYYDSWDNEQLNVYVDDKLVFEHQHNFQHDGTKFICGSPQFQDLIKPYEIEVAHTARSLNVKIEWTVNQKSDDESGGIREIQILGKGTKDLPTCVTLYTECDFEGESQSLCDDTPVLNNRQIKSIYLPEDVISVKLFEDVDFSGKSQEFTSSQQCLDGVNYQFFTQINKIKILNKPQIHKIHYLKRNSHKRQ